MQIHAELFGEPYFNILGLAVTNTLILAIFCSLVFLGFFLFGFRKKEMIPNKIQNFCEFILESLFNLFESMGGSKEKTKDVFPLAATLFIFILINNLLEVVPGVGVFNFLRSPSSDLHFTLALAIFSIGAIHLSAINSLGLINYSKKFINLENPIMFFAGILELLGEFTKMLSLSVRLFGNLFAGKILLIIITLIIPLIFPLPFLGLEIFVGIIQALIFSSLIVVFYALTTSEEY